MKADLFANDGTLEIAGRGLFREQERIRQNLHALPKLQEGTDENRYLLAFGPTTSWPRPGLGGDRELRRVGGRKIPPGKPADQALSEIPIQIEPTSVFPQEAAVFLQPGSPTM